MRASLLGIVCIVGVACATAPRDDVARGDRSEPVPAPSAEDDLDAVVRRARYAFRPDSDALVGGHDTFSARVSADGSIAFTPIGARETATLTTTTIDGERRSGRARLFADGRIEIERGSVRERLENTKDGLEQSWIFAVPPAVPHDLVVRVSIGGYDHAGTTDGGHHFRERAGGRLLRYGRATWIDRDGRRTRVDTAVEGSDIVLTVPRDLVAQSSFPATLDPIVGPETTIDTAPVVGTIPAIYPSVAPGPSGTFLVTMIDRRLRAREGSLGGQICATRVSAAGVPVQTGIYVGTTTSDGSKVVYDSVAQRWSTFFVRNGVVFSRVDAAGKLLDLQPRLVRGGAYEYTAAFDGANTFVATSRSGTAGSPAQATFIDATGNVGAAVDVSAGGRVIASACDPAACAVLVQSSGTQLVRVTRAGALAGTTVVDATRNPFAIASSGTEYLVITENNVSPSTVYATRVSSAGVVLDATPLTVGTGQYATPVVVYWNGSRFVVAWINSSGTQVVGRRVRQQADGAPAVDDPSDVVLANVTQNPVYPGGSYPASLSGTVNGTTGYLGWHAYEDTTYGSRIDTSLTELDAPPAGVLLAKASNAQWEPAVARSASGFLVAWSDQRSSPNALWNVRLDTNGAPLGAAKMLAVKGDHPSIASDGTNYVVTWRDDTATVRAATVSAATGDPSGAGPTVVTTTSSSPQLSPSDARGAPVSIAHDGQSYVVTWTDFSDNQFAGSEIRAARLSNAGALLDANPIRLGANISDQFAPMVASDGKTGSFIVWPDERIESFQTDLFGARIDRNGTVLDASPIAVATGGFDEGAPNVAWDGTHYVVVWHDHRGAAPGAGIYMTRVGTTGGSLDTNGTQVSKDSFGSLPYAVTSMQDGTSLVAWGGDLGIRGSFVRTGTGEVLDFGGIAIGTETGGVSSVALAPASAGKALVVGTRYRSEEGAPRVFARFIESGKTASTTCTMGAECASRWCTDGVCCSEKCDGPCQKCDAAGKCVAVISANDDACAGSCDAMGACKKKNGDVCSIANECASGFCADGFCCESACDGGCDSCNEQPGKCTSAPARSRGAPSCSPFVCNGLDRACPTRCGRDEDCADGFNCDRPTGTCVSGAVCSDTRTLREPSGTRTDCWPYACRAGACLVACTDVSSCSFPAACDELGRCVDASSDSGFGCSVSDGERTSTTWIFALGLVAAATAARASRRRAAR